MANNQIFDEKSARHPSSKVIYVTPVLKTFGSVNFLTLGAGGTKCDGGNTVNNVTAKSGCSGASDPSIKENVARIGTHSMGFGLYLFDYKPEFRQAWGHGRQFGVMANEIELVMPEAVVLHPDGYKMVNYDMLGIARTVH